MAKRAVVLSAEVELSQTDVPFKTRGENEGYAHLLDVALESGINLVLAHPDCCAGKTVASHWRREATAWHSGETIEFDAVWDRDCRVTREKQPLFSEFTRQEVPLLNNWEFERFVSDKHQNFYMLPDRVPFGVCISRSTDGIHGVNRAVEIFRQSTLHSDLTTDRLMLKPRTSYASEGIVVIEGAREVQADEVDSRFEYLLQGFLETGAGVPELGITSRHDLRVIVCDGKPILSYMRCPSEGNVVSNVAAGGSLHYVQLDALPSEVLSLVAEVDKQLSEYSARLYAIDMGRGKSGRWWLFEINARPGFTWDSENAEDVENKKYLHQQAVSWFARHCPLLKA